jgi:hypothetical protein
MLSLCYSACLVPPDGGQITLCVFECKIWGFYTMSSPNCPNWHDMSNLCPLSPQHPNGHRPIFSFEMSILCPLSPQYPNGHGSILSFEMSISCLLLSP